MAHIRNGNGITAISKRTGNNDNDDNHYSPDDDNATTLKRKQQSKQKRHTSSRWKFMFAVLFSVASIFVLHGTTKEYYRFHYMLDYSEEAETADSNNSSKSRTTSNGDTGDSDNRTDGGSGNNNGQITLRYADGTMALKTITKVTSDSLQDVTNHTNHTNNITFEEALVGRERIWSLLRDAGVKEIDVETLIQLPTWEEVTHLYGNEPVIYGLDTCKRYRETVPPTDAYLGVAGLFNTGTNALHLYLQGNIQMPRVVRSDNNRNQNNGILTEVPWGKHWMGSYWNNHTAQRFLKDRNIYAEDRSHVMPIVVIRDPYTWMKSMCSVSYGVRWFDRTVIKDHCPFLVPKNEEERLFVEEYAARAEGEEKYKALQQLRKARRGGRVTPSGENLKNFREEARNKARNKEEEKQKLLDYRLRLKQGRQRMMHPRQVGTLQFSSTTMDNNNNNNNNNNAFPKNEKGERSLLQNFAAGGIMTPSEEKHKLFQRGRKANKEEENHKRKVDKLLDYRSRLKQKQHIMMPPRGVGTLQFKKTNRGRRRRRRRRLDDSPPPLVASPSSLSPPPSVGEKNTTTTMGGVPVTFREMNVHRRWDSVLHLYKEYYHDYMHNFKRPRLIVRFEDLLFHPKRVIEAIRDCAGATPLRDDRSFAYVVDRSKYEQDGVKTQTNMISAMIKHAKRSRRFIGMTDDDKKYAYYHLSNNNNNHEKQSIMELFSYQQDQD